ncbi:MAG TPA: N-acetyltransferase [Longimicrobiaceae bacterium]|nr:N-acetyltransferase [Longimicrobiaceae bacterium]
MIRVRDEGPEDAGAIRRVHELAFGRPDEAALVDALRREEAGLVSLVAELGGAVVGHVAFSPASVEGADDLRVAALAPMAVLPAHQRGGTGSALVQAGIERCRERAFAAVFVLGHPAYYPRFGFAAAAAHGIACEFPVPDEAFMALELLPGALEGRTGVLRYARAFHGL